jgi:nitroreductase
MIEALIGKNRSYRRFDEQSRISEEQLRAWVNLGRLSASGANNQPLKYLFSTDSDKNKAIFSTLAWAGALKDWPGPSEGERPTGYIIILGDTKIAKNFGVDHGIAAQSIMLGAVEAGYGGCMIASIKRDALREVLQLDEQFEILLVLALGKPAEKVVITELPADGSTKYWRDEKSTHFVPKRSLDDIIL